jgi:gluconolactonase
MCVGDVARKHHIQLRGPDGALRYEECFTRDGFEGPYTILYHLRRPHTQRLAPTTHGWLAPESAEMRHLAKRHYASGKLTAQGGLETVIDPSGSNGLALGEDGALVAATHDRKEISRFDLIDGSRMRIVGEYQGQPFNSPNDLVLGRDGTLWFTDPDFQRGSRADAMQGRTSVFRVWDGIVSQVDDGLREPNGIALSPDGSTLYVGAYGENKIYSYPVHADGGTGARTQFASVAGPDGATIDCAGNVYWASGADGLVHVFSPAGVELGTIAAGAGTTNVAFGGSDRQTLFITSGRTGDFGLYSVHLDVPGYPH